MARIESLFGIEVDLDETYYVYYFGKPRELTRAQLEKYHDVAALPDMLRFKEMQKLDPSLIPSVHPKTGMQIVEMILDLGYIPVVDKDFAGERGKPGSKRMTLVHVFAYEFWEKEYERRKKSKRRFR